jgi:vacuolar-type H+-ATPase subunit D/Vma8
MNFSDLLTDDQKREILVSRIQQFASEAYQISLNQKVLTENAGNEVAIASNDANLATLEQAIQVHQDELASLPTPTPEA